MQSDNDTIPSEGHMAQECDQADLKRTNMRVYHREYKRKRREENPDKEHAYNRSVRVRKMLDEEEAARYAKENVGLTSIADVHQALKYLRKMSPDVQQAVFHLLHDV